MNIAALQLYTVDVYVCMYITLPHYNYTLLMCMYVYNIAALQLYTVDVYVCINCWFFATGEWFVRLAPPPGNT